MRYIINGSMPFVNEFSQTELHNFRACPFSLFLSFEGQALSKPEIIPLNRDQPHRWRPLIEGLQKTCEHGRLEMVHATGRKLLLRLNPGPTQTTLQGLYCRVHEDKNLRTLKLLCEHGIKLVERPQGNSCFAFKVARELFDDAWPNSVVPPVGIPVTDDPGGSRLFCRHVSVPLDFRHEPLLLVKDLNQQRHLTQSMG